MVTKDLRNCTGCGVCAAVCPKKCLDLRLNNSGFYVPVLNNNTCVNCGLCDNVCPKETEVYKKEPLGSFAVSTKDINQLFTSSSGGICYEIAKQAVLDKKKVCAVTYDYEKNIAKHIVITEVEQLESTKGSKYFQSYSSEAFDKVLNGEEWVVFGSPCQIAGLARAAEKKKLREKLLLIDFFCHGTPSINLWKKYLNQNNKKEIETINFRSKEKGWHGFSILFNYKDGTSFSDLGKNLFYELFFSNTCLNESCYNCNFKAFKSYADIRVGDLWGEKYKENTKGVSGVFVFTDKGVAILEKLKDACNITKENFDIVLEGQMFESPKKPACNKKVLRALTSNKSLSQIYNVTLFPFRLKGKLKYEFRRMFK